MKKHFTTAALPLGNRPDLERFVQRAEIDGATFEAAVSTFRLRVPQRHAAAVRRAVAIVARHAKQASTWLSDCRNGRCPFGAFDPWPELEALAAEHWESSGAAKRWDAEIRNADRAMRSGIDQRKVAPRRRSVRRPAPVAPVIV